MKEFYFDMDGVLSDWKSAFEVCFPDVNYDDYGHMPKEEKRSMKVAIADHPSFYLNMKPLEHACTVMKKMMDAGYKVSVLTACGKLNPYNVSVQKLEWLKKHFPEYEYGYFPVRTSKCKSAFANTNAVLIDDREKSIVPFVEANGNAVKYVDGQTNLYEELKVYL